MELDPDHSIVTPWLVFNTIGQGLLAILLITYAAARLPQHKNAYLINLILVTFLSTFPPALLFYSGHQHTSFPGSLCLLQAVLIDSGYQMTFVAQVCLVCDTWSELRSLCLHTRHTSRTMLVKCILLTFPYLALGVWSLVAYTAAVAEPGNFNMTGPISFVYCRIKGHSAMVVKLSIGIFLGIIVSIHLFLEIWMVRMMYIYPTKVHDDPTAWRTTTQFAFRLIIFSLLKLVIILMNLINGNVVGSGATRRVYELLASTGPLITFLAFGTEMTILMTWKTWAFHAWNFITFKHQPNECEDSYGPQPHLLPTWHGYAYNLSRLSTIPESDYTSGLTSRNI